jgi:predicted enzyme related to lactoylglutathione lyase
MVEYPGRFVWYELITTDMATAKAFYADVLGWSAQDASTPDLAYTLLISEGTPVGGLMDLPEEARKLGATPRWMGYVGVDDVDATADRLKRLGGAVYVPPTNSNIGRISVVADPQTATLGLVEGLKPGCPPAELDELGRASWHELLAADGQKAFAFYRELLGWQKGEDVEIGPAETYQLFSAGGQMMGGMRTKNSMEPIPFWLYYFNIGDIDTAVERVMAAGSSDARTLRVPRSRCRGREVKMLSREPLSRKSAGPRSGAGFHREAGWSPSPAVRDELSDSAALRRQPQSECLRESLPAP